MPSPQHADQTVRHAIAQPRLAIETVQPVLDGGRFASKCLCGRALPVSAVIFGDGHDQLSADLLWRGNGQANWQRTPKQALGNDRWTASLEIAEQRHGTFADRRVLCRSGAARSVAGFARRGAGLAMSLIIGFDLRTTRLVGGA